MPTISVPLQKRSYPIWVDNGLLSRIPKLLKPMDQGQKWVMFSQSNIYQLYGNRLIGGLEAQGFDIEKISICDGEQAKTLSEVQTLYSELVKMGCDRSSTFLAFGGGVVGDITGFVASTFMRGVDYIQMPTTLLAMVDSAIGGKTGVNLPEGKNLVGTIHQPKAVVVDPGLLDSLPKRERVSALAEIFKYGAILDRDFFVVLSENLETLMTFDDPDLLTRVIARCCKLKIDVVGQDEFETDLRRILNFGHTIGHALEKYFGYGTLRHGEAVAYGMLGAGWLSIQDAQLKIKDWEMLEQTVRKLPLPELPEFSPEGILSIMKHDKKVKDGKPHFVLLEEIGKTFISNSLTDGQVLKSLEIL